MLKTLMPTMAIALLVMGCSGEESGDESSSAGTQIDSTYLAETDTNDAMPVGTARTEIEDGQEVSLVGIIGGSAEPFVEGLAAFTIVDPKVAYCADEEGCPTPWDYCCTQDQVVDNIATVKIVDSSGAVVTSDAKALLGVKELNTVVVTGVANRDDQGNLSISASKIFIRP